MTFRYLSVIAGVFALGSVASIQAADVQTPLIHHDAPVMICANEIIDGGQPSSSFNPQPASSVFGTPTLNALDMNSTVTIPVVVHVFGDQWPYKGANVTDEIIIEALQKSNEDFNGLNDDFNTVDEDFISVASTLDINFALAKLDPQGNPTTGIKYYPNERGQGLGNFNGSDNSTVKQYAWDNFKYMNIYITLELEEAGTDNYSGIAWLPNIDMSRNNVARVVYNGRYLFRNTSKEFASVLTHEFGHWLGLRHTFEGGCEFSHSSNGSDDDGIADTPSCLQKQGCTNALNCKGEEINGENYMDYNTTCQKMFTIQQVDRMKTALQHDARRTLWTDSNLVATGLAGNNPVDDKKIDGTDEVVEEPAVLPPILRVTQTRSESVHLSWSYEREVITTDPDTGEVIETSTEVIFDTELVAEFQLYQDGKLIATIANNPLVTDTTYRISGLNLHQNYVFAVTAIKKETGEISAPSASANARTNALSSDLDRELAKTKLKNPSSAGSLHWLWILVMFTFIMRSIRVNKVSA